MGALGQKVGDQLWLLPAPPTTLPVGRALCPVRPALCVAFVVCCSVSLPSGQVTGAIQESWGLLPFTFFSFFLFFFLRFWFVKHDKLIAPSEGFVVPELATAGRSEPHRVKNLMREVPSQVLVPSPRVPGPF